MAINSQNGNTLLESGFFPPCRAATTAALTALAGLLTVDGVTLIAGDRVLVKDQADQTTNGIYAASTGTWTRTSDATGNTQLFDGMAVIVAQGTTNAGLTFICTCTDDPVVVGTSLLTFSSQAAVASALQTATSTTSAALTTGAKTFATQAGKNFAAKQWVLIYETSNPDNNLLAEITSYSGTSLVVSVAATAGSGGPYTDWTIVLTNTPAAAGRQPPVGTGNMTGPGSATSHNLPRFADTTGKLLEDSGLPAGTLAGLNALTYATAGTASVGPAAMAAGAGLPPYVAAQPTDNLTLANDGTNPTTDIQVSAGRAPDDSGLYWLTLAGLVLKRIDQAWAAGGGVGNRKGMLLTGSSWLASKCYHLWLIGAIGLSVTSVTRSSNVATVTIAGHPLGVGGTIRVYGVGSGFDTAGAVITAVATNTVSYANTGADVGATGATAFADGCDIGATQQDAQNYPSATLPSGFTIKQCLGSVLTDGSKNLRLFLHVRDEFMWQTPIVDLNADTATGSTSRTLSVPTGLRVKAHLLINTVGNSSSEPKGAAYVDCPDYTHAITTQRAQLFWDLTLGSTSGNVLNNANGTADVITNTSGQVQTTFNGASLSLVTTGWREFRRALF
jgi:hypothetical protein